MNVKEFVKVLAVFCAVMVAVVVVGIGIGLIELEASRFFGVQRANIQTDIQRQSRSYVEGTLRELRNLRVDYTRPDNSEEHKAGLRQLILHRAGELDWSKLPEDMKTFLEGLQ